MMHCSCAGCLWVNLSIAKYIVIWYFVRINHPYLTLYVYEIKTQLDLNATSHSGGWRVCVCVWVRGECESACQAPELLGESHTTLHLCSRRRRNSPSQQHRPCLFLLSAVQAPLPSQNPPLSEVWAWSDTCSNPEVMAFNFQFYISHLFHR